MLSGLMALLQVSLTNTQLVFCPGQHTATKLVAVSCPCYLCLSEVPPLSTDSSVRNLSCSRTLCKEEKKQSSFVMGAATNGSECSGSHGKFHTNLDALTSKRSAGLEKAFPVSRQVTIYRDNAEQNAAFRARQSKPLCPTCSVLELLKSGAIGESQRKHGTRVTAHKVKNEDRGTHSLGMQKQIVNHVNDISFVIDLLQYKKH
ncbi:hypothetical protein Anapl_12078 [Anas platyrhynchos]|uniref:Uncharacterized protein n=1 Tax=Anas platyrhynchos TaxID=8839 RepID=R0JD40_ANAPL|nr:hypothetical protein Anapl_12078 [Anas platyrhynchos]